MINTERLIKLEKNFAYSMNNAKTDIENMDKYIKENMKS